VNWILRNADCSGEITWNEWGMGCTTLCTVQEATDKTLNSWKGYVVKHNYVN